MNNGVYPVEVMKHGRTSRVSDAWNVDPLMVEVFDRHLLFKLTRWTRSQFKWPRSAGRPTVQIIVTHSTPATKQLQINNHHIQRRHHLLTTSLHIYHYFLLCVTPTVIAD